MSSRRAQRPRALAAWLAFGACLASCSETRETARAPRAEALATTSGPLPSAAPTSTADAGPDSSTGAGRGSTEDDAKRLSVRFRRASLPVEPCADAAPERLATCVFEQGYAPDTKAAALARSLFEKTGTVAGLGVAETMDGGFRGVIQLVPALPIDKDRRHLEWAAAALIDIDDTLTRVEERTGVRFRYRRAPDRLLFSRSVGRTTPSAFVVDGNISYNVAGSLLKDESSVRETLVHELFHINDEGWSEGALQGDYAAILTRCFPKGKLAATTTACLAPYAPNDTVVRGGTYYAFQRGNGESVREYGAELALRWYKEHRAIVRGEVSRAVPFRCGPEENARAWAAFTKRFASGADLTRCP